MMRNTPEMVMDASFESGSIIARQHGFDQVMELRAIRQHDYVFRRSPRPGVRPLTLDDWGPEDPNIKISEDGWLEIRELKVIGPTPRLILIDRAGVFRKDNDYLGLVAGRFDWGPRRGEPMFRWAILPDHQQLEIDVMTVSSLPQLLEKNDYSDHRMRLGLLGEIFDAPPGYYHIEAAAAELVGTTFPKDEWGQAGAGQRVVRGVLEDTFQMLERYHRLQALSS